MPNFKEVIKMYNYRDLPITKKGVSDKFKVPIGQVDQQGKKQLFIIRKNGQEYLVSYLTIVGFYDYDNSQWALTTKHYSPTTTKQLIWFKRNISRYVMIDSTDSIIIE